MIKYRVGENVKIYAHYMGRIDMCNVVVADKRCHDMFHKVMTLDDYNELVDFVIQLVENDISDTTDRLSRKYYGHGIGESSDHFRA